MNADELLYLIPRPNCVLGVVPSPLSSGNTQRSRGEQTASRRTQFCYVQTTSNTPHGLHNLLTVFHRGS